MLLSFLAVLAAFATPQDTSEPLPRRGALGASFGALPSKQARELALEPGQGLVVNKVVAGLTSERAGLKEGDIVVAIDGTPVKAGALAEWVRGVPAGKTLSFDVRRGKEKLELRAPLVERPRDPGNANYSVVYDHVVSHGQRMRTIITKPKSPGKHPALYFIQGFSPVSYDYTLETATGDVSTLDGPLLFTFANDGFVTLRIEKPGVGDSEGGPFAELDYTTELDIYRQALAQLKALPEVDADKVFLFGHSMGGAFGPMVASESPVKGIAVYGVAARTWFEYLLDTLRYQGLVAGDTYENADEKVRQGSRLMALVFHEGRTVEEVTKEHPELAFFAGQLFPGGMFNGKSLEFWRQLGQINMASYWAKLDTHVLAARGASDHVVYDVDHRLIADIVNRAHPGRGKFVLVPNSDHLFHDWPSEAESLRNFTKGKFNPAFATLLREWVREVLSAG